MDDAWARMARDAMPSGVDFCSIRRMDEVAEAITVRSDVLEPVERSRSVGAMVTVHSGGGLGYAATPDLSRSGLAAAARRAKDWADACAHRAVYDMRQVEMPASRGSYASPVAQPWRDIPLADRIDRLRRACRGLAGSDRIVDRVASAMSIEGRTEYVSSNGAEVAQTLVWLCPDLTAVANEGTDTQVRSLGSGRGASQQGGAEVLERVGFDEAASRVAEEALALLDAPNCPSGAMDLVLAPDQMMLQIHESIGHPIELDRILGDERNYAGTSFVTLDMFGSYRYGSDLLNVSFDPTIAGEMASYGFDDEGAPAERVMLIERGILQRPLGGVLSAARIGRAELTANSRATSWNRPPIDRMANLNIEPGDRSFDDLIGSVERGIYMETNSSWSIDDSRNKFQFGCEFARLIENGELRGVVKNPNYRGISATFWRALAGVGNADTWRMYGTPFCGKGEPNQVIRVGHASPVCLFRGIDVFGGA